MHQRRDIILKAIDEFITKNEVASKIKKEEIRKKRDSMDSSDSDEIKDINAG